MEALVSVLQYFFKHSVIQEKNLDYIIYTYTPLQTAISPWNNENEVRSMVKQYERRLVAREKKINK